MARRLFCALAGIVLAAAGCQHALKHDGSYRAMSEHAMRLDVEFHQFHADVKDIFFGIEEWSAGSIWDIYGD